MKHLIINADDFGLSEGVTQGILQAMNKGVVSSTSAMLCLPGCRERVRKLAGKAPGGIGLHLQLTNGRPILEPDEIPSLVLDSGEFPRSWKELQGRTLDPDQVLAEWRAQLDCLRSLGVQPTHLDTHHNIHLKPEVFPVYCRLGQDTGLPLRASGQDWLPGFLRRQGVSCPDYSELGFLDEPPSRQWLLTLIGNAFIKLHGQGVVEMMTHPGLVDKDLTAHSHYLAGRESELAVLCSPGLAEDIKALGVELVDYRALSSR